MGFQKDDQYPCLLVDSSSDVIPSADKSSLADILDFLRKQNFISDHRSHSAKEKQTLYHIEEHVSPLMNQLLLPFKRRLQFYSVPKHFKSVKLKWELSDYARNYSTKTRKLFGNYLKNKELEVLSQ